MKEMRMYWDMLRLFHAVDSFEHVYMLPVKNRFTAFPLLDLAR